MDNNWIIDNLNYAFGVWNDKLTEMWSLLTQSPQAFKGGTIWQTIQTVNGAMQGIGYGLLVLFLAIGIVLLLIMPQQVQISEKDVVNGRAFPTMLVWLMLAMSALLVGREAYNMVMHRPVKTKTLNLLVEAKALVIVLILVVTYLLAEITGLFVVGAVFCALAFLLFFRCKKPLYYAITVSMAVLIWVVFHFVLNVSF